ncbi:MlaA family lipoprotein [Thalassotalea agariperforans]
MLTFFINKRYRLVAKVQRSFVVILILSLLAACSSSPKEVIGEEHVVKQTETAELGPYEVQPTAPSVVSYQVIEDPLRFINEPIFTFNDAIYEHALSPFSRGYQAVVPAPIDQGITNFFNNLTEPVSAINHLLQGKFTRSGKNLSRVLINSTIGLFGLFDPASHWFDINEESSSFAKTFEHYGAEQGAYLVLPFLGPSDVRGLVAIPFDRYAHPLNHINDDEAATQLQIIDGIHGQIPLLANYPKMLNDVDNRYEFIRNLFMQRSKRDQEFSGKPASNGEQAKVEEKH